jgi:hypothetical protein
MKVSFAAALCATTVFCSSAAFAEEGMWLPNQTPGIAAELRAAGLQIDPAKLGDLNAAPLNAIVSLGGCSASFVSPDGLVVTNHHCVYDSIQYNSKPEADYLKNGFLAKTNADELGATPGTRIYVIEDLRDVTAAMTRGLTATMSGLAKYNLLDANRKALIAACEKQASRRCDVRAYFGGATYYLQQQLEIKDVRLVYAPATGVGAFGGETDNWMWPRHTGDWGFYRAYVAPDGSSASYNKVNVPYHPKSFLKVAKDGVKDGDFVMVSGFPGSTNRHATAAEARFSFEAFTPFYQKYLSDYSDLIARVTAGDAAATIKYASIIRSADNYKKETLGEIAGAEAIDLNGRKGAQEAGYRDWVKSDPARMKAYSASIAMLDALVAEVDQASIDDIRIGSINRAQLLRTARLAYRFAKEQQKPDSAREAGYQERDRKMLTERLTSVEKRYVARVDRAVLEASLALYAQAPTARRDAAFEMLIGQIGLDRLYADTKQADTATRVGWLDKPAAAFEASDDPFIKLAVALYPNDIATEQKAKDRSGRMQAARSAYMRGMLAYAQAQGQTLYPDANSSLRFTYGHVTGKSVDGQSWAAFTTAEGFVAKQRGKGDFDAPATVIEALKAKDWGSYAAPALKTLPIDFMSTVDITGGNSGSATLNARGEFVGLAFDGTLDGVISNWSYDAKINRTIHVDSRFMLWMMDKVEGAGRLLTEMGVK